MARNLPQVKIELCSSCGMCIEVCPCHSVDLHQGALVFSCPDDCTTHCTDGAGCGCLCEDACPEGAISCSFEVVLQPSDQPDPDKPGACRREE